MKRQENLNVFAIRRPRHHQNLLPLPAFFSLSPAAEIPRQSGTSEPQTQCLADRIPERRDPRTGLRRDAEPAGPTAANGVEALILRRDDLAFLVEEVHVYGNRLLLRALVRHHAGDRRALLAGLEVRELDLIDELLLPVVRRHRGIRERLLELEERVGRRLADLRSRRLGRRRLLGARGLRGAGGLLRADARIARVL